MTTIINPEDTALFNKLHIERAVEELARGLPEIDPGGAFVTAMGATLHYLFVIAAERHGEDGVRFLERMVPGFVQGSLTGVYPGDEG